MRNLLKPGVALFAVSLVASGALALTFGLTDPIIQRLIAEEKREAISRALQEATEFREAEIKEIHFSAGFKDGERVGEVFSPITPGYSGEIEMEVGVKGGSVTGVEIVRETETPGLGTKIRDHEFLVQFRGKTLTDPIEVRRDIDAITGATISSRAVAVGVRQALEQDEVVKEE